MILIVSILILALSLLAPWFYVAALAAMLSTAKKFKVRDILQVLVLTLILHGIAAAILNHLALGQVTDRIAMLLGLPFSWILYFVVGIPPAMIFLSTYAVISAGRNLVLRRNLIQRRKGIKRREQ